MWVPGIIGTRVPCRPCLVGWDQGTSYILGPVKTRVSASGYRVELGPGSSCDLSTDRRMRKNGAMCIYFSFIRSHTFCATHDSNISALLSSEALLAPAGIVEPCFLDAVVVYNPA